MDNSIQGTYRHFKGGLYRVYGIAKHSETLEELVVYRHIDDQGEEAPEYWVRPRDMFFSKKEVDGILVDRFEKVD